MLELDTADGGGSGSEQGGGGGKKGLAGGRRHCHLLTPRMQPAEEVRI